MMLADGIQEWMSRATRRQSSVVLVSLLSCVDWGRALKQPLCTVTPAAFNVIASVLSMNKKVLCRERRM